MGRRWHMIDTDNSNQLTPAEALAAIEKLARTGQNFMLGTGPAGCVLDGTDAEIVEDLFFGIAEYAHRAAERRPRQRRPATPAPETAEAPPRLRVGRQLDGLGKGPAAPPAG